jgi:hypothetical protein
MLDLRRKKGTEASFRNRLVDTAGFIIKRLLGRKVKHILWLKGPIRVLRH